VSLTSIPVTQSEPRALTLLKPILAQYFLVQFLHQRKNTSDFFLRLLFDPDDGSDVLGFFL
jgi:hypothetical protein